MRRVAIFLLTAVAVLVASVAGAVTAVLDLTVLEAAVPRVMVAGEPLTVRVVARNDGPETWVPEEGFKISYHWFDANGEVVEWDGERSDLPASVAPGDVVRLSATVRPPERGGDYLLQWDLVHEDVAWAADVDPTPAARIPVTVGPEYALTVLSHGTPRLLVAEGRRRVALTVRNDGLTAWSGDGTFAVAAHWFDGSGRVLTWDGERTALPRNVPPGEEVRLDAVLATPAAVGRLAVQWDVVHEGVCWVSERDPTPPPMRRIWLVAAPPVAPLLLVLATVAATVVLLRVRGRRGPLVVLAWGVAAVAVLQWQVLREAGVGPTALGAVAILGGAALLMLPTLVAPRRIGPWLVWLLTTVLAVAALGEIVYVRFFGDLVSVASLGAARHGARLADSATALLAARDLWLLSVAVTGLILTGAAVRGEEGRRRSGVAAALLAALAAVGIAAALAVDSNLARQVFRNVAVARHVGPVNFHLWDVGRATVGGLLESRLDDRGYAEIEAWFRDSAPGRAGRGADFGAARGLNLVMIQVESLQDFAIDMEVGGEPVMPFLRGLSKEAVRFTEVTDQTEQGRSADAGLATQVSIRPPRRGTAAFLYPGNDFTGLAEVLAGAGYTTLSAVPFDGAFWNRRLTHPAWGFGRSLFAADFDSGETIGWGLNDRGFLAQMAPRIIRLPEPFAVWMITLSLHHPFAGFPNHHQRLDVGRWEDTPFGEFLHTMRYFDGALEEFVRELDESGLADRTVLVLWGDHDAGFEWTPEVADAMGVRPDEVGWYLSQQVPLIVRVPGDRVPKRLSGLPAGHVDVTPTLLALFGVDPAQWPYLGRNLLGEPDDVPVVGEYGCWTDRRRLWLAGADGTLASGRCLDRATLEELPAAACSEPWREARRRIEVSEAVLVHDLQERLGDSLHESLEADGD